MNSQKNFSKVGNLISDVSKEHEKRSILEASSLEIKEMVDHEPSDEVEQFVRPVPEKIKVTPDLQKAGVEEKIAAPKYPRQKKITLSLSDEMVVQGLHAPITSSFRWLAEGAQYLLRKAHITLKKIHGHVVRIMQK